MAKLLVLLVLFCFIHSSISQSVTCADGLYPTGGSFTDKGQCTTCVPLCKTCTGAGSCTTFIDKVKGLTSGTPICSGAYGYNSNKDICDNCMEGCYTCSIDYNICTMCK